MLWFRALTLYLIGRVDFLRLLVDDRGLYGNTVYVLMGRFVVIVQKVAHMASDVQNDIVASELDIGV